MSDEKQVPHRRFASVRNDIDKKAAHGWGGFDPKANRYAA
jgi:hypothetical protein